MKLDFIKQNKSNKRFNYTPRYYKGKDDSNPYEFGSRFEKHKDTYNKNDYRAHWEDARNASRHRGNRSFNRIFIYVVIILVFISLWILDFDLSIFR
ncbi:MAG: hypothetical protein JKZ03_03315 [Flavobacteriaceae bacterium]|nr:hypothetical protein [Flavobacteriaceae bacterium]